MHERTSLHFHAPRCCSTGAALLLALFTCLHTPAHAQVPAAEEIVQKQLKAYYQAGKDFQAKVEMRLVNAQGSQRQRLMNMLRTNVGTEGDQRYLVIFEAPADVRGMGFLVWKYARKEDDRWLYFPALKAVKRVAADDKRSSFVGSDFTYEDISGRDADEERHTLLRQEDLADRPVYVLESQPRSPAAYAKRISWVDRERWLPLKEEYHDAEGKLQRVFKAEKVESIGGVWTVTARSMLNSQSGHRTEVVFKSVRYDGGLAEDLFTERSLRNPPALAQ
jgi:outer membrane lipoprotein-sorting protein